jgi:eukaryotic-like serine/threonine-protein kinase
MDDIGSGNDQKRTPGEPTPGGEPTQIDVRKRVDESATLVVSDADLVAATSARTLAATESASQFGGSGAVLQIGSVVANRYEILDLLGEGGMGAVYKAHDIELERVVALKVIKSEFADHPEILRRFKQELILARQVTDRNVIRIFDIGETGRTKFITMEYLEGENLHQILKQRGKLEAAEAVEIMEQAASGLAAAHREGIIHRDLKPGNIMRDKSGRVVVMDFGLARTFSGDGMTRTGAMLGTIEYMSPEQAQGKELKASSDVFTAGLILYELVSGVMPFHAESAIASLLMRTQQRAVPLADVDKKIPGTLSNIVAKCLEKDPANRYQSAVELDADLRAWQASGGKKVAASSVRLRMNRLREMPWQSMAFTGVLVVALAVGLAWLVVGRQKAAKAGPQSPISVLVADFANNTGDPLLDNTLEPMVGLALEGASFINVFGREDARKVAEKLPNPSDKLDQPTALRVALNQGIYTVVTGDISLRGDGYEITAIALDPSSRKVLATKTITVGDKKDILSSLPTLVDPIRTALGDTEPPAEQFNEVSGGFKAASLEAVHQDSIGVDEQFAGKFQDAFDSFQKAAQLDPNFARAYTGMAAMDENLGKQEDALKYMTLAMQYKDNMTEREQYRDLGLYYRTKGAWKDCVDEYGKLVAKYPADRVGWNNLSLCDAQLRDEPDALQAAQKAVDIVPKGVGPRLNLAFISVLDGDFAAGEKAAGYALSINPKAAQGILILGEAELGEGKIDNAESTFKQLDAFGPAATSTATAALADLDAYQGKYADAARLLAQGAAADLAAKDADSAARKFVALANVEEMQGKNSAAVTDTDKALKNSQSMEIEFLAARNYVDAGELAKAQKLATSLSSALTNESQAYGKIVLGLIALKKKDSNGAIRQIKDANGLLNTWIGHFDLGRAYLAAGAFTEADAEFDTCVKRRGEAIELFMDNVPTYADLPPVYFDEGSAQQGMKVAGFADLYKTYLGIRGQSTEDPMVADARKRIGK